MVTKLAHYRLIDWQIVRIIWLQLTFSDPWRCIFPIFSLGWIRGNLYPALSAVTPIRIYHTWNIILVLNWSSFDGDHSFPNGIRLRFTLRGLCTRSYIRFVFSRIPFVHIVLVKLELKIVHFLHLLHLLVHVVDHGVEISCIWATVVSNHLITIDMVRKALDLLRHLPLLQIKLMRRPPIVVHLIINRYIVHMAWSLEHLFIFVTFLVLKIHVLLHITEL